MAREPARSGPPAGVLDVSAAGAAAARKSAGAHTGFYRIRIYLPATPEPGCPDHVVAARDDIEAEARCFAELGIRSVDKSVNQVEITAVPEKDFLKAQARRLNVDLRQTRKTDVPENDPDYGKLQWAPAGHTPQKQYWVSETGEVLDKKEEKAG